MRVLHCIWRMGVGGAERQLVHLTKGLVRRDIDVHVVTAYDGAYDAALAAAGAVPHRLAPIGKYDITMVPRLVRLFRQVKPNVVCTWLTQMDIAAGLAARIAGVPWVLCERCSAEAYPPGVLHFARARTGVHADAIVANAEVGREYWQGLHARHLHVVPNIVPIDEITAVPAARGDVSDGDDVILFVGRFTEQKNIDRLLDALAVVLRDRAATAVFCGDGPLRAAAEQKAAALGISGQTRFLGTVPDVWSWMKRATVVVAVSVFEGNPNAVLEAMAANTPLVVSRIAAHRALLDDGTAWMVDPESAESIAEGLVGVLENRGEARARAQRASEAVKGLSPDDIAAQYDDVYRSVMKRKVPAVA